MMDEGRGKREEDPFRKFDLSRRTSDFDIRPRQNHKRNERNKLNKPNKRNEPNQPKEPNPCPVPSEPY